MKEIEWHPQVDPVASLIYSADGNTASAVIIDGKIIMENRKILTVEESEVKTAIDQKASAIAERTGVKCRSKWPIT
jgi:5-methylthioadenosine/S-adenosylhomocysteine deaminase